MSKKDLHPRTARTLKECPNQARFWYGVRESSTKSSWQRLVRNSQEQEKEDLKNVSSTDDFVANPWYAWYGFLRNFVGHLNPRSFGPECMLKKFEIKATILKPAIFKLATDDGWLQDSSSVVLPGRILGHVNQLFPEAAGGQQPPFLSFRIVFPRCCGYNYRLRSQAASAFPAM